MFQVIKYEGRARRGKFRCAHGGEVQTPVFMNVGTQAAIKGGERRGPLPPLRRGDGKVPRSRVSNKRGRLNSRPPPPMMVTAPRFPMMFRFSIVTRS